MSEPIYYGFDKFKEFEKAKIEEVKKAFFRVPDECYKLYGSDLDKCSTQQNEGCGRCNLGSDNSEDMCTLCENEPEVNEDSK